jgi:hypothetical protein
MVRINAYKDFLTAVAEKSCLIGCCSPIAVVTRWVLKKSL